MEAQIGQTLSRFQLPVDVSKAREMALALGADEWRESDPATLAGRAVVPSFTACSGHWQNRRQLITGPLGLELSRVLHGEQRWTYERPIRVGDVLDATTTLESVEEREGRRGGPMRFVTMRTRYRVSGAPVLTEDMVLVETRPLPTGNETGPGPKRTAGGAASVAQESSPPRDLLMDPWKVGPLTRTDIVRYAGASGDFTRIHHDEPYATALGLPQVFTMGMLQGGMVAVHLARAVPEGSLLSLSIRFRDRLWPGESLVISGWWSGGDKTGCELEARADDGRVVVTAIAEVRR